MPKRNKRLISGITCKTAIPSRIPIPAPPKAGSKRTAGKFYPTSPHDPDSSPLWLSPCWITEVSSGWKRDAQHRQQRTTFWLE
ncbi:hypothetical protein PoB_000796400 [Plakobranchus ocellatus]|uniref:Uncharacterized protein n=1 Tax=Plakobranchus ocellatus TaxID=259542 RepID=A0AAV3YHH9_9GAST|nr:hypothetical protein PoB_000796400 [Plakobranchus ocellatus]